MAKLPLSRPSSAPWGVALVSGIALLLSGCSTPSDDSANGTSTVPETGTLADSPQVFDWTGHVVASNPYEGLLSHYRPGEDALWPVVQEGILFSVDEMPQAMEVALDWEGSGEFLIMLHSHKEHGTNVYVEHVTAMDRQNPKCLRVPAVDLTEGVWQVMVHTNRTLQTDFTLHLGLLGGAGHILEDERHGHWVQDGEFQVDLHEIEPCQLLQTPVEEATAPTALPPETHFEFGESLGCDGADAPEPRCVEFMAGPGGTGSSIDGHWIQLGKPYWGLLLNSTVDQAGVGNDSDCAFTDAGGSIIAEDNDPQPCAGQVPQGAEWIFVYPYSLGALGITVDFALPPAA